MNMQQFLIRAREEDVTEYLERVVLEELRESYGDLVSEQITGLAEALERIYVKTDKQFIFLIDEWDCVMRERQESEDLQKQYLDFLRNLLKDQPYVALAYMTGILPVKKYGQHSALNMFWEYSMTDQRELEEYTGFTESEVKTLCQKYGMNFEDAKKWYDGYSFSRAQSVYSPNSVVQAICNEEFGDYWTETETYESLKYYIGLNEDGLKDAIISMLGGGKCRINTRTFQNDMSNIKSKDDVLTLLVHLGYLAYDSVRKEVYIPNQEVADEI